MAASGPLLLLAAGAGSDAGSAMVEAAVETAVSGVREQAVNSAQQAHRDRAKGERRKIDMRGPFAVVTCGQCYMKRRREGRGSEHRGCL